MEECDQIVWNAFDQFGVGLPCSIRGKKLWKSSFSDCFSKAKTKQCDQKSWNALDEVGISKSISTT